MFPAGCISHDDESAPPPQPGRVPNAPGHYPALLDGDPRVGVHVLFELLFVGRICGGIVVRDDRICSVFENKEGIRGTIVLSFHFCGE